MAIVWKVTDFDLLLQLAWVLVTGHTFLKHLPIRQSHQTIPTASMGFNLGDKILHPHYAACWAYLLLAALLTFLQSVVKWVLTNACGTACPEQGTFGYFTGGEGPRGSKKQAGTGWEWGEGVSRLQSSGNGGRWSERRGWLPRHMWKPATVYVNREWQGGLGSRRLLQSPGERGAAEPRRAWRGGADAHSKQWWQALYRGYPWDLG